MSQPKLNIDPKRKRAPKVISEGKKDGRPEIQMNWPLFDSLCQIHCTQDEIAVVLGIDKGTIDNKAKRDFGLTFSQLWEQKRSIGKQSLRRMMWQAAHNGNVVMMIWLSKNLLGYTDKTDLTTNGEAIGEVRWSFEHRRNGRTQPQLESLN